MFENLKIKFIMASPTAAMEYLYFDGILAAATVKEKMGEDYFDIKPKEKDLRHIELPLDRKYGVWCASIGFGNHNEFVGSWCKRWDDKNDDIVKFPEKNKIRVDIASGGLKNYHIPLVYKSYKEIVFYARGNYETIKRLLDNHIFYIGKKASQGYGEIKEIIIDKINDDYSLFKDGYPVRPVPVEEYKEYFEEAAANNTKLNITMHAAKPPYWRTDCMEYCFMPILG
jgi:CRISPR type IV-associated protein Csf3